MITSPLLFFATVLAIVQRSKIYVYEGVGEGLKKNVEPLYFKWLNH